MSQSSGALYGKDIFGLLIVVGATLILAYGVSQVASRDYVAAALLFVAGSTTMRAGVQLLRPTVGE